MADNRSMTVIPGNTQTLPVVYFSNINPNDLLPADTLVTFTLNMTNAVGNDAHAFNPDAGDWVAINGIPSFAAWDAGLRGRWRADRIVTFLVGLRRLLSG